MTDAEQEYRTGLTDPNLEFYIESLKNQVYGIYPFAGELFPALEEAYPSAASHSERTSLIAATAAELLSFPEPEVHRSAVAALLHDIGKVAIPPKLQGGPLTPEETETVRMLHMERGREILRHAACPPDIMYIIMSHHDVFPSDERYKTGQVYPRRNRNGYEGSEQRLPQTSDVIRAAKLIWLVDKVDRDVNGYSGKKRKNFEEFARGYYTNYDPSTYSQERLLFASVFRAVRHIFYPQTGSLRL